MFYIGKGGGKRIDENTVTMLRLRLVVSNSVLLLEFPYTGEYEVRQNVNGKTMCTHNTIYGSAVL